MNNIEKEGKFRYFIKRCCCCEKMIVLHFVLTSDKLLFYEDENKIKLFLEIPREQVIAINKRQIDKHDVFKFSIYYQNPNEEIIHEIKLKTTSRSETDKWIKDLRKLINPKRYEFKYDKENYIDANELYHFRDTKKFYLALCHLEYILLRNRMIDFFEFYRNRGNINNNNNDSMLFHDENDTERLNKENNVDINDIQPKIE
jgi:hypothetical protein